MKRLLVLIFLAGFIAGLHAQEEILDFSSHIKVQPDSQLIVTETITVRSEQKQIQRGIFRDFPTIYTDNKGREKRVGFKVIEVLRDGKPEPYHLKRQSNGMRVYIGRKDVVLPPDEYVYTLTYSTHRQLGFFDEHVELYWNVTGNGWDFPINNTSATVEFPAPIPPESVRAQAYTGYPGSKEQAYELRETTERTVSLAATRKFKSSEGFTIVVEWPHGHVHPPGFIRSLQFTLSDSPHLLASTTGLALSFAFLFGAWFIAGRDPDRGIIIPRFDPVPGLSPAGARLIWRLGYDDKCFATALISLASKGLLEIQESGKDYQVVRKQDTYPDSSLSPGEALLMRKLFAVMDTFRFTNSDHDSISKLITSFREELERDKQAGNFVSNNALFGFGVALVLGTSLITNLATYSFDYVLARVVIGGLSAAIGAVLGYLIGSSIAATYEPALRGRVYLPNLILAIVLTIGVYAAWPFLASSLPAGTLTSINTALIGIALLTLFRHLLKAPTAGGQKLRSHLEGLRMYLVTAESEMVRNFRAPEISQTRFEKLLPYAVALDVENEWTNKFMRHLETNPTAAEPGYRYRPSWYYGSHWNSDSGQSMTSALTNRMASSISASSSPPGSSSGGSGGSGGGGFSGGGGGGGGGGGW